MKRFRFTILAVCLVLLWLGWNDISLFLQNRHPAIVTIEDLEDRGTPRDWVKITGGYLDLTQAISTSGTIELDALLVPLESSPNQEGFDTLVETRDPNLLRLFRTYHFSFSSAAEQQDFLNRHQAEFHPQVDITGMVVSGLIASSNRDKLVDVLKAAGLTPPEDVLFISEGKTPPTWRGFFFAAVGLAGIIKVLFLWRRPAESPNKYET